MQDPTGQRHPAGGAGAPLLRAAVLGWPARHSLSPLLHGYYRPDHHANYAFYMAVKNGVVQHHWEFGNMPAMPQVSPEQAADIIAYVRALQRQAGLLN